MNITKLGFSSWIIILNIVLLLTLIYVITTNNHDSFINYPASSSNPLAKPTTTTIAVAADVAEANNNYASILMFIQKNPSKSIKFIQDIKQKFFDNSCTVKSNIDFSNMLHTSNGSTGMPFN